MWPKDLIRAEPAGAKPTQGKTTFTPPMQFPSFGLGDHSSGREEGPTVLVAHHAAPVDPLTDDMEDVNHDQYFNHSYDDAQPEDFEYNLENMDLEMPDLTQKEHATV